MGMHDATEMAYKNGFEAGAKAAAKDILGGIGERLQKAKFTDMKERFILLDQMKSYEEKYKGEQYGMHIRASYAMEIGQKVYSVLDPRIWYEEELVSEETVTDIGARGFWISARVPAEDDHGDFISWNRVGVDIFFTREEAEAVVNSKCGIRNSELEDTE